MKFCKLNTGCLRSLASLNGQSSICQQPAKTHRGISWSKVLIRENLKLASNPNTAPQKLQHEYTYPQVVWRWHLCSGMETMFFREITMSLSSPRCRNTFSSVTGSSLAKTWRSSMTVLWIFSCRPVFTAFNTRPSPENWIKTYS